jgi:hypothetical protein
VAICSAVSVTSSAPRQAGLGAYADELDCVAAEIAGYVAQGEMPVEARKLFEQLRARWPRRFEPEAALAR